jgi:ketosteroid isomerase-like protein
MAGTGENTMTTRDTVQGYFTCLKQKKGWEPFLSDDMVFNSFTSTVKQITGKAAYLEATKRFYSTIISVTVKDLLVEGEKACALTHYELRPPEGKAFSSDVAEIFKVRNGKIGSFDIYFDSVPFPK